MLSPRWKKVLTDIIANKTRTILVVLSIAVGVFAVGMILGTQVILSRDLPGQFSKTNPATAEIYTENFDDDLVASMARVPGVAEAQGFYSVTVRAKLGPNNTRSIGLMQTDGKERRINKIEPVAGAWPPAMREITLERASLDYLGLKIGDTITVEDLNGKARDLRISGTAHYMNLPPPMFAGQGYGFATFDTLEWLGGSHQYSSLGLTMETDPYDVKHNQEVASAVRNRIEGSGRKVFFTYVPSPSGRYPAEDGITVIIMLLGVLGVLALGLSGFLVINTVSALVTQQTRQIGMMKAIGGRRNQIIAMYLSTILGYGALALVVGIPLGSLGAAGFSTYMAQICNFDIQSFAPPLHVMLVELAVGLGVPVLAGLYPVFFGTSITVREALSPGGGGSKEGSGLIDRVVGSVRGLSRPLLISLRNTFRRKGRLALTLFTLTLGGAIFIAVVSVRESTALTLDDALQYFNYDIAVNLKQAHKGDRLVAEVLRVPGVKDADFVNGDTGRRVRPSGTESNNVTLLALPADSPLVKPTLLEGRWLLPEDENAVVLNTIFLKDEPDIKVGSDVVFKVDGKESTWKVVGTVRGVMTGSIAYANRPYYFRVTDNIGKSGELWVVTDKHDAASQDSTARAIEEHLAANGMKVAQSQTISFVRVMIQSQFDIIVVFLMVMAVLLAIVGGLGLMGTMSLNVIERTREIGVMRATGADNATVRQIFIVEALLIGLLSWAVGAVLAFPISSLLAEGVGMAFLQSPLSYQYSVFGVGIWLVLVVIIATLASILPALSASRLTVREVLAYE